MEDELQDLYRENRLPQLTKRSGAGAPFFNHSTGTRAKGGRSTRGPSHTPLPTPACQILGLERRAQKEDTAWLASIAAPRQAAQRPQPGCSTLSWRPAPRLYTPLGSAALPASLTRGRWASGPGRSPRVWPIAFSQPKPSSTRCQGPWSPGQLQMPWRRERKMR